jgi:hypothetical protein
VVSLDEVPENLSPPVSGIIHQFINQRQSDASDSPLAEKKHK